MAFAGAAHADIRDLRIVVTPLPGTTVAAGGTVLPSGVFVGAGKVVGDASVGREGLDTYIAYKVKVQNKSAKTLTQIRFTGAAVVYDPSSSVPAPVATFFSSSTVACVADASATSIDCNVGTLKPYRARYFNVVYKLPTMGAQLDLNWSSSFTVAASPTVAAPASFVPNPSGTAYARLITQTAEEVKSSVTTYVPIAPTAFKVNTGTVGAVATTADPWTTTVIVPPATFATTARIRETEAAVFPCVPGACFDSQLTIPGTFDALQIFLRRDASTIPPGFRASDVVVYYIADGGPNAGVPIVVQKCDATVPAGPAPHVPCIVAIRRYTEETSPTPEWLRDKEIEIRALDNGRYIN